MAAKPSDIITLSYSGKVATITLDNPKKLNALNADLYYYIATLLREIAQREDIYVTLFTGTGRFFSAYGRPTHPALDHC